LVKKDPNHKKPQDPKSFGAFLKKRAPIYLGLLGLFFIFAYPALTENNLNSKIKFHIPQAIDLLAGDTWPVVMSRLLNWLPINIRHQIGPDCMPVLINKYNREYFEDPTGKVRVTIDSAQNVYDQRFCAIPNLYRSAFRHPDAVIEIKGPPDSYEKIKQVSSELPIRVSRNSKYSLGYEAIEFR